MTNIGMWNYNIIKENDHKWVWCLSHGHYFNQMVISKPFKTFDSCQKDAIKRLKRMHEQFGTLIDNVSKEKS